ncbi:hypothetical protein NC653_030338 [Populus alba x Populus x berolinensis]|uniref:Uncharacterized protein n=1 Tax=Populus alba x Populus x berolinensis TaxID=444605 RepID=A0AAD6LVR8_9ROSI|nr:hypothetical protein NC653_030338 [Populus alba x Populus x berolinensis]
METGMDKRAKMVACFDNQIEQMGLVRAGLRPLGLKSVTRENHPSFNTAQEFKTVVFISGGGAQLRSSSEELEGTTTRLT